MSEKATQKKQPNKPTTLDLDAPSKHAEGADKTAGGKSPPPAQLSPTEILSLQQSAGNKAVQRMLAAENQRPAANPAAPRPGQTKLDVNEVGDKYEQEADQTAKRVVSEISAAPEQQGIQPKGADRVESAPPLAGKNVSNKPGLNVSIEPAGHGGQPLAEEVRAPMEQAFGTDFSDVRVHTNPEADKLNRSLNARAVTAGQDIYFKQGEYAPSGSAGQELLAHELTHVEQQRTNPNAPDVQRQEIPPELLTNVDHRSMTDEELQYRYDLIAQTLSQFNQSTAETALLEQETRQITDEIARREALAAGRTFTPESIDRMRQFFINNARSANPLSCIACMNQGLRLLLDDPRQAMGSEVQTTMGRLQGSGRAGTARVIEFNDDRGRMTTGVRRPHVLRENIWDTLLELAGNDVGWSVFGLSLMDGYHSVTLTLDNNNPSAPRVYWSDQWSTRGGWQEFNRASLNAEITRLIQGWWDNQPADRKSRTRVTLWRLNQ